MEQMTPEVVDAAQGLWSQVQVFLQTMLVPSRLYQVLAVVGLILLSWLAARLTSPLLTGWLRAREAWPKWRLRFGLLIDRRLRLIYFCAFSWLVVAVMRQITWPSRSQLIALAAAVATAWLAVTFAARIIRNPVLRRLVTWGAWIWVTLYFLDFLDPAAAFLDSLAISLGSVRISALTIIKALAVGGLLFSGARFLSRLAADRLAANKDISPTMRVLTGKLLQVVLFGLAIVIGLRWIGLDLTGLAVFSGAIGLGLGFGLQKVVSNLVSGVIILLDKSIKPGDVISIGDTFGWIEQLGARYVSVVTRDGKEYLIPNEDLVTGQVVNWSHTNQFVRLDLNFGTAYHDDPHEVSKIAINAALSVKRVVAQRTPVCWVTGFGDSSVDYVLRFWISDAQGGLTNVRGQVFLALWDGFKKHGITIPFPQREVRVMNETLAVSQGRAPEPDGLIVDPSR